MAFSKQFTFLALLVCSLHLAYTTTIDCTDKSSVDCAVLAITTFDEEFKKLHIEAVKKIFPPYIDATKELIQELPQDELYVQVMKDTTAEMDEDLKKLDELIQNTEELAVVVARSFGDLDMEMLDPKRDSHHVDEFVKAATKYNPRDKLYDAMAELLKKTTTLWDEIYAGLRDTDKKDLPIFDDINNAMKFIEDHTMDEMNFKTFFDVITLIGETFHPKYIRHAQEIFDLEERN